MSRVLLKRCLLLGSAVGVAACLAYVFSAGRAPETPSPSASSSAQRSAAVTPPTNTVAPLATPLESLRCKDLSPLLASIDGLSLRELRQKLAPLGPATEETHWENTFYTQDGTVFVWHLVPSESAEGVERWELKHFREDADGPTLIEGRPFLDKQAALAYRAKVVSNEAKTEQKLSWNYEDQLTVTFTAGDSVRELRVTSPLFQLGCSKSSCRCEDYK